MKVTAKSMERALNPLVSIIVNGSHDLLQQRRRRWYVQPAVEGDEAVGDRPRCRSGACSELAMHGHQCRVRGLRLAEAAYEVEPRCRDRQECACWGVVGVPAGESVSYRVRCARLVFHREVETQQLADPVMLRDRGEALVEEVLEAVVVRLDDEAASPKVQALVTYGEDEADQLPLISRQRAMVGGHRPTEERDGVAVLDEYRPEAIRGRITLHDEGLGEVRERQHRCRRHSPFEGEESRVGVVVPGETFLLQECSQGRSYGAEVVDEFPVVAC